MATASLIVIGVGVALVLAGAVISILDWRRTPADHPGVETRATGLSDQLGALQNLLTEVAKNPLGTQLIVWGIVLILIGGTLGGVSALGA